MTDGGTTKQRTTKQSRCARRVRRGGAGLLLILGIAVGGDATAGADGHAAAAVQPIRATDPGADAARRPARPLPVSFDWDDVPDRRWVGPSFRANRLQDWRVEAGQVVCINGRPGAPVRTLMLRTVSFEADGDRSRDASVVLRTARAGADARPADGAAAEGGAAAAGGRAAALERRGHDGAWRGVILGAGSPASDHRRSTLVHNRPGPGGGLLVLTDDAGRLAVVDFSRGPEGPARSAWSLGGALQPADWHELEVADRQETPGIGAPRDEAIMISIRFSVPPGDGMDGGGAARGGGADDVPVATQPTGPRSPGASGGLRAGAAAAGLVDAGVLEVTTRGARSGAVFSRVRLERVPRDLLEGSIGLVSHGSPTADGVGHAFDAVRLSGSALRHHPERASGPVIAVQYTVADDRVRVTAQGPPLDDGRPYTMQLERSQPDGTWSPMATADLDPDAWTWRFSLPRPDTANEGRDAGGTRMRLRLAEPLETAVRPRFEAVRVDQSADGYAFTLRPEPDDGTLVVASLNCHKVWTGVRTWDANGVWYPHDDLVRHVAAHDPDLLYFAGDQVYEGDLTGAQRRPIEDALLDYHDKWYRWCEAFGPLTRDRPTVTIPDDHDVYHGNIWGAGGRRAVADRATGTTAQDSGGYVMPPRFVNMVHRTQTSHLPPSSDPAPIEQGIATYHTTFVWGGVSFAVVADRMFKSAPRGLLPDADVRNGWPQNAAFDPSTEADPPGAELLGARQEAMLEDWASDYGGDAWTKVLLSQSPFGAIATIPESAKNGGVIPSLPYPAPGEHPANQKFAADMDSGAWPPSGRQRAVRALQRAGAVHLAGDQHLASLVQYGLEAHGDGGFVFCAPAIANTWPRRFFPPLGPGGPQPIEPGAPSWTGHFRDAFGHRMSVFAVANPQRTGRTPAALHDRMPGYGIVRFDRSDRTITFECWPRWADPTAEHASSPQYPGWPRTIAARDAAGATWSHVLPSIDVSGDDEPVIEVRAPDGTLVTSVRLGPGERVRVPGAGPWIVRTGDAEGVTWSEPQEVWAEGATPSP